MEDIGHSVIDEKEKCFSHLLSACLSELQLVLKAVEAARKSKEKMTPFGMDSINLYDSDEIKQTINDLAAVQKRIEYLKWEAQFKQELVQLTALSASDNMHPIARDFVQSYQEQNLSQWTLLLSQLEALHQTKAKASRFYQLHEGFAGTLPQTAKLIEMSAGSEIDFSAQHEDAFELKKLQTWLDETKDTNTTLLKKQLEEEHIEQKRLIRAKAVVSETIHSDKLSPVGSASLIEAHMNRLQQTDSQLKRWSGKRYLCLIGLKDVTAIEPFSYERAKNMDD